MFIVFLTTLTGGFLGVLSMFRMTQVGWRFIRLIAIFALCLTVPVLVSFGMWGGWRRGPWPIWAASMTACSGLAAFVVLGLAPVSRRYGGSIRVFSALGGILALGAAWAWGFDYHIWPGQPPLMPRLDLVTQALSALLIGSVSLAAALGHAYLTHTSMTIHPLRRIAHIFATALTLRIAWLVLVMGWLYWRHPANLPAFPDVVRMQWLMLVVRGGIGLIIPAIFANMVMQTVRLRSTQSTTGIFYFTLVLVFVGELAALHLTRETGLPF